MNFIKVFISEAMAETFAKEVNGTVIIRYDWDEILCKIIREYVVKY